MLAQTASALVTIDSVYVGNIGNAAEPTTGYGAVNYGYSIGKYEVTLNQYTEFLNAVAKTDTYGLYNTSMGTAFYTRGISQSGVSGSYAYSVIGNGNRPVTFVSWYDAARFANWLHNGQPVGLQTAGTTETGAYTMAGSTGFPTRNSGWRYCLPSYDEWYKAAYHQPAAQGGDADNYWKYPTASNARPNSRNANSTDANSANCYWNDYIENGFNGGYAVNNSEDPQSPPIGSFLTEVGAYTLADSFYGTFDQGGNVQEWNDDFLPSVLGRGYAGGAWDQSSQWSLEAGSSSGAGPAYEDYGYFGFRIAIREPSPPVITITASSTNVVVGFNSEAGFIYTLESTDNLDPAVWGLPTGVTPANPQTGTDALLTFTIPSTNGARFFQVKANRQ